MTKIDKLKKAISEAKTIIIGAGSGLSTSAGFTYTGERFEKYFSDFAAKYGFRDMYSGGFAPFEALEEHWAYWSRYIMINRYMDAPKSVYKDLLSLVRDREMTAQNPNAVYACLNFGEAIAPKEIAARSICINGDIGEVLGEMV